MLLVACCDVLYSILILTTLHEMGPPAHSVGPPAQSLSTQPSPSLTDSQILICFSGNTQRPENADAETNRKVMNRAERRQVAHTALCSLDPYSPRWHSASLRFLFINRRLPAGFHPVLAVVTASKARLGRLS
jgi:hypothetical protein